MTSLRILKPNVTREEAIEQFSRGAISHMRAGLYGPLRSVADFFVPFKLFQVEIFNNGRKKLRIFGLDAASGLLDLYGFDQMPGDHEVIYRESRNRAPIIVNDEIGKSLVATKVQRLLFTTGFFRLWNFRLSAEAIPGEIYVPYWVGFRGRRAAARFVVMDAVRRRMEGGKVRELLRDWLASTS
ncbi:MAG TPA: hypothetical protein VLW84_12675 [Terriglobales bacterium]|nr:hypothetical protein [Terriglobales bacterium]